MNANEEVGTRGHDDVVELGVASVETKGGGRNPGEFMGDRATTGISDD